MLSSALINGTLPPSLGGLTALHYLDLSYNTITGSIPSELGGLRSLV